MRFEIFEKGGVALVEMIMRRFDEDTAIVFTTEVEGRTVRHDVRPFRLAENPDRDFRIDLMGSEMDPRSYNH